MLHFTGIRFFFALPQTALCKAVISNPDHVLYAPACTQGYWVEGGAYANTVTDQSYPQ